jgi:hypothetical protein
MNKRIEGLLHALQSLSVSLVGLKDLEFEERRKRTLLAYFALVGLILLVSLAVSDFAVGNLLEGTIEALIACWMLSVLFLLKNSERL